MDEAAPPLLFHALGEAALCCSVAGPASLASQQRFWQLCERGRALEGVEALIPGMNNLTLVFDPLRTEAATLEDRLRAAWQRCRPRRRAGRRVEIPVHYGGDHGPDLEAVAAHCGLTPAEVVRRHAAVTYDVYFIGFQPGFAYMGELDPALATPRRAEPRVAVPAGSVGIGGSQTGIYPLVTPGGWQLIGRTALRLFDPDASPPTLLAPGDRVRFIAEA
jgi:KipI family sensor histidine kinase inhibitor